MHNYSKDEIAVFYDKCIRYDLRQSASQIEAVMAGIGGAFGGGKKIEKLLKEMRQ